MASPEQVPGSLRAYELWRIRLTRRLRRSTRPERGVPDADRTTDSPADEEGGSDSAAGQALPDDQVRDDRRTTQDVQPDAQGNAGGPGWGTASCSICVKQGHTSPSVCLCEW